jgi:hypothetical protein
VLTLDRRASCEINLSVNTVGGDLNRAFLSTWAVLLVCIFEEEVSLSDQAVWTTFERRATAPNVDYQIQTNGTPISFNKNTSL